MNVQRFDALLPDDIPTVHLYKTVPSTNLVAKDYAERGEKEGVFIAEKQTAGRGRQGRSFFSPENSGLYVSFLLRPSISPEDVYILTTTAAVAVSETIELFSGREARIKWVNDVLVANKKVCGILVEGSMTGQENDYAVIGIGINLFPPEGGFPDGLEEKAGTVLTGRRGRVKKSGIF